MVLTCIFAHLRVDILSVLAVFGREAETLVLRDTDFAIALFELRVTFDRATYDFLRAKVVVDPARNNFDPFAFLTPTDSNPV